MKSRSVRGLFIFLLLVSLLFLCVPGCEDVAVPKNTAGEEVVNPAFPPTDPLPQDPVPPEGRFLTKAFHPDRESDPVYFVVDLTDLAENGITEPRIVDRHGSLLGCFGPIGFSHAAYRTFALVKTPEGERIFEYLPQWYAGDCDFSY